jgi:hypothetical protein
MSKQRHARREEEGEGEGEVEVEVEGEGEGANEEETEGEGENPFLSDEYLALIQQADEWLDAQAQARGRE